MNIFVYPNGSVVRENNWEGKAVINFIGRHWGGLLFIYRQIIIEIENCPQLNIDLEYLSMIPDHHTLFVETLDNNFWSI